MNCESVGSDFQAIWQKILKRQVYANFGQSSVTKTLPSPLKARIGKSGNELVLGQCSSTVENSLIFAPFRPL